MNKARKLAGPTASTAAKLASGVAKGSSSFAKGFTQGVGGTIKAIKSLSSGTSAPKALPKSPKGGPIVKYQSPGKLAKTNTKSSSLVKPNSGGSSALALMPKQTKGGMVDLSVKPTTVRDVTPNTLKPSNSATKNLKPANNATNTSSTANNTLKSTNTTTKQSDNKLKSGKKEKNIGPGIAAGILTYRRQSENQ